MLLVALMWSSNSQPGCAPHDARALSRTALVSERKLHQHGVLFSRNGGISRPSQVISIAGSRQLAVSQLTALTCARPLSRTVFVRVRRPGRKLHQHSVLFQTRTGRYRNREGHLGVAADPSRGPGPCAVSEDRAGTHSRRDCGGFERSKLPE